MPNQNLSRYQFSYDNNAGLASVEVHVKGKKREGVVGQLYWNTDPAYKREALGHITSVAVHPEHQRQGMATEMLNRGQKWAAKKEIPAPDTTVTRHYTPEGAKWKKAVEGAK